MQSDLKLYWWGQTVSTLGSVLTAIALPVVAVVRLGASAGQLGLMEAAATLPAILLGLPAGAWADRIARPRRALLALDALSALAVGLIALGLDQGVASIGCLTALGAFDGVVSITLGSVYFVHLRQLVGAEAIGPARARLQVGQYGAALLGRVLAGPAIVLLGSAAALTIDAVSYLLSAVALLGMRAPDGIELPDGPADHPTLRGAADGLLLLAEQPFHRALLLLIAVPAAESAAAGVLTAPFLLRDLRVPSGAYGLAFVLSGVMGLAGSALAGRLSGPNRDPRRLSVLGFAASVVCSLLLPLAGGPLPLALLCAALGLGLPVFAGAIADVALSSVFAADVPQRAMGRAMAALQVLVASAALLGALAGGALGDRVGVHPALWAVELTAFAALTPFALSALRAARRLRTAGVEETAPGLLSG